MAGEEHEIPVGGPVIYSANEIAELAFSALKKKPKITRIPSGLANLAVRVIRPFNKQTSDLVKFFITAGQCDGVAPPTGTQTLASHYEELASQWLREK